MMPYPLSRPARRVRTGTAVSVAVFVAVSLGACATPGPVSRVPSPSVPIPAPTGSPTPTTSADAFRLDVNIDLKTVSPLRKAVVLARGRTVLLLFRSDHDVEVTIKGAGIDKTIFVARLTSITSTFVVDQPGVVTIKSTDPVATIAELTVT